MGDVRLPFARCWRLRRDHKPLGAHCVEELSVARRALADGFGEAVVHVREDRLDVVVVGAAEVQLVQEALLHLESREL